MCVRMMALCCALAASSITGTAQVATGSQSKPAAGTIVAPSKTIDSELSLIEGEMMSAVKAMPAEKFDFAPSAAIFAPGQTTEFATVRSFAQQARHVAQANYSFYMTVSGLKPDVDVKAIGTMTKKEDIVAALAGSFAFGHKAIATITEANAFEAVSSGPGIQTRATLAQFAVSHAFDHYGQLAEYLRMNGIVPPASAKK